MSQYVKLIAWNATKLTVLSAKMVTVWIIIKIVSKINHHKIRTIVQKIIINKIKIQIKMTPIFKLIQQLILSKIQQIMRVRMTLIPKLQSPTSPTTLQITFKEKSNSSFTSVLTRAYASNAKVAHANLVSMATTSSKTFASRIRIMSTLWSILQLVTIRRMAINIIVKTNNTDSRIQNVIILWTAQFKLASWRKNKVNSITGFIKQTKNRLISLI